MSPNRQWMGRNLRSNKCYIMIYIAHRGLFSGPDKNKENHPMQVSLAIEKGFDCEVDLHYKDNKLYLGHDEPTYEVDEYWLRHPNLWIHAKTVETLTWLYENKNWKYNYFWHEDDHYTLTSKGYIWTHPKSILSKFSIMVMPEYVDLSLNNTAQVDCYGICSDYVENIIKLRNL